MVHTKAGIHSGDISKTAYTQKHATGQTLGASTAVFDRAWAVMSMCTTGKAFLEYIQRLVRFLFAQRHSNMQCASQCRICFDNCSACCHKSQIKLAISCTDSILTSSQPVTALTPKCQAPGKVASDVQLSCCFCCCCC